MHRGLLEVVWLDDFSTDWLCHELTPLVRLSGVSLSGSSSFWMKRWNKQCCKFNALVAQWTTFSCMYCSVTEAGALALSDDITVDNIRSSAALWKFTCWVHISCASGSISNFPLLVCLITDTEKHVGESSFILTPPGLKHDCVWAQRGKQMKPDDTWQKANTTPWRPQSLTVHCLFPVAMLSQSQLS